MEDVHVVSSTNAHATGGNLGQQRMAEQFDGTCVRTMRGDVLVLEKAGVPAGPIIGFMLAEADGLLIRRLHDDWIKAERRGDAEAVLCLCTETVAWVSPDGPPIVGREAGRRLLVTPGMRCVSIEITDFTLDGADDRAVKTCRYETVFESTETHRRIAARGSHTWWLQHTADGWRVTSVSWQPERG